MADKECRCSTNVDVLHVIETDATVFAEEFAESFIERCPKLARIGAAAYMSRIAHILVMIDECEELGDRCSKTLDTTVNCPETHQKVQDKLMSIATDIKPIIEQVMRDRDLEVNGARH